MLRYEGIPGQNPLSKIVNKNRVRNVEMVAGYACSAAAFAQ